MLEPGQRRFLVSILFAAVLVAALFKFVIGPIREQPEREQEQRSAQRDQQSAKSRRDAIEKARDLTAQAHEKWRADVDAAGASGALGSIPPLVSVRRNDSGDFVFTNISGQPICFSVARVSLPARCDLGSFGTCQNMAPGEEIEFPTEGRRNDPPCHSSTLEFRIGKAVTSDLPWWSDSALEDFDRVTGLLDAEYARALAGNGVGSVDAIQTSQLRAEIKDYEEFLADTPAADRWREVLQPLKQIQLDVMAAKQSAESAAP